MANRLAGKTALLKGAELVQGAEGANVMSFLASDAASISGTERMNDGGYTAT